MNKLTVFLITFFSIISLTSFFTPSHAQARTVTYNTITGYVPRDLIQIAMIFRRDFDFKLPNNSLAGQSLQLSVNDSLTGINSPTTGEWYVTDADNKDWQAPKRFYAAAYYGWDFIRGINDPVRIPMDDRYHFPAREQNLCSDPNNCRELRFGFKVPSDQSTPQIVSSNNNVLTCNGLTCTALKPGNTQINVEFPNNTINGTCDPVNSLINNSKIGFGYAEIKGGGGVFLCNKMKYQFPSIVYSVTVKQNTNTPAKTEYKNTKNITSTTAKASWTYQDEDNDPQTNSQLEVYTDANFSGNPIFQKVTNGTVLTETMIGLKPNTQYYPRVKVLNTTNSWSEWASGSSFTTKPAGQNQEVTLEANPLDVQQGDQFSLTWITKNVNTCEGQDGTGADWAGSKSLQGNPGTTITLPSDAMVGSHTYTLSCTGNQGIISDSVDINVTKKSVVVTPGTGGGNTTITPGSGTTPTPASAPTVTPSVRCTASKITDVTRKAQITAKSDNGSSPYMFTLDPDGGTSTPAKVISGSSDNATWDVDYSNTPIGTKKPIVTVVDVNGKTARVDCSSIVNYGKRVYKEVAP